MNIVFQQKDSIDIINKYPNEKSYTLAMLQEVQLCENCKKKMIGEKFKESYQNMY